MSKSELINNASEDENNGTEESETSDLQSYMYEPCVSKVSVKENCPGKNSSDSEEGTSTNQCKKLNTNQWLLMQKIFAAWIKMKFVKLFHRYTFIRF